MNGMTVLDAFKVDQTILASDPERPGNCVAACAATFLGMPLHQVPHFIEVGGELYRSVDDIEPDRVCWWAMLCGFMAGRGLEPVELDNLVEAKPAEVVWVAGMSCRGVYHQVLFRDGVLWHDPHPSKDGVLEVDEIIAWRPIEGYDHSPTAVES